ncbi:MAG: hypothetical protein ACE3JN_14340, partial [Ectobacillus sp.]
MSVISFSEWLKLHMGQRGYKGEELEGEVKLRLAIMPKSLQQLAENAHISQFAKRSLDLYIASLRDPDEQVQMKREMLEIYLREAK